MGSHYFYFIILFCYVQVPESNNDPPVPVLGEHGDVKVVNIHLMSIRRRIKSLFKKSKKDLKSKGHELIIKHKSLIFNDIQTGEYVIEIGSDRDAGSTYQIAKLADSFVLNFITVDIDKNATSRAGKIIGKINKNFRAVNDFGEKVLSEFTSPIRLVYLDAFDIPGDWHSQEVIESYRDRNLQMTLENCHRMHYDCAVSINAKMPVGGFVCFDDVNPVDDQGKLIFDRVAPDYKKWSGKGATAIPFLIENGFEVTDNRRACALLKRIN